MATHRIETEMLATAGRLLLEFNESTGAIERTLATTARALTSDPLDVTVMYGGVVVSLGDDGPLVKPVRELRYNAALQARVHSILRRVRDGGLSVSAATAELARVEADTPKHSRWLAIAVLGAAASALAALLGADVGAVFVVGIATALGLFARQELGRRHVALLALPFTAAFIGAVLGGIAIRLGWTQSLGLVLIVPSLMLVPGPHLINGLLDLIDNYLPMSIARLGLATAIVVASATGNHSRHRTDTLGTARRSAKFCHRSSQFGFRHDPCRDRNLWLCDVLQRRLVADRNGGLGRHGWPWRPFRSVECRLPTGDRHVSRRPCGRHCRVLDRPCLKVPFAVIAFAGAVTMMPGLQMYRTLSGVLQLAQPNIEAKQAAVASTLSNAAQASLVNCALALGLVIADRVISWMWRERASNRLRFNCSDRANPPIPMGILYAIIEIVAPSGNDPFVPITPVAVNSTLIDNQFSNRGGRNHASHRLGIVGGRLSRHSLSPRDDSLPPRSKYSAAGETHHLGFRRQHSGGTPGPQLAALQRIAGGVRCRGRRTGPVCATRHPQSRRPPLSAGDADA